MKRSRVGLSRWLVGPLFLTTTPLPPLRVQSRLSWWMCPALALLRFRLTRLCPTGVSHGLILIRQKLPSCQLQLKKLVCYSRSWCAPGLKVSHCLMVFHVKRCPADAPMSWLWVSGVCAPRVRLAWKPFPQLCVQPQMMICCVMPCWKTCTVSS